MISISQLLYFCLGVLFVLLALPFLQSIADIIMSLSGAVISKIGLYTVKNNCQIKIIQEKLEPQNTQAIGFNANFGEPEYFDDDEDDEEYEDEDSLVNKKVGF